MPPRAKNDPTKVLSGRFRPRVVTIAERRIKRKEFRNQADLVEQAVLEKLGVDEHGRRVNGKAGAP